MNYCYYYLNLLCQVGHTDQCSLLHGSEMNVVLISELSLVPYICTWEVLRKAQLELEKRKPQKTWLKLWQNSVLCSIVLTDWIILHLESSLR